jgi:hypothetical protein
MSNLSRKLMMGAAGAADEKVYVEDVFSTYVYGGNSTNTDVVNGLDLAGEGGMLWHKNRSISHNHYVFDTERGAAPSFPYIQTNDTAGQLSTTGRLVSWNSDGYTIGNQGNFNETGQNNVIWTFRKAPRFFDVVTYTGNGVVREIAHNLNTTVGFIAIKRTNVADSWLCYHRRLGASKLIQLNVTDQAYTVSTYWNSTNPTDTTFTLGTDNAVNNLGDTYVAYLFAHDPLGPSGDGSDGLIACGSYTGNGSSTGPVIDLGWEPQWVMFKRTNGVGPWAMFDNMRGMTVANDSLLRADVSDAELTNWANIIDPQASGFQLKNAGDNWNGSGSTYIYIAIRRGPMRAPESGTEVFNVQAYTGNSITGRFFNTGFDGDLSFCFNRTINSAPFYNIVIDRLRGNRRLFTGDTSAEVTDASLIDWFNKKSNNVYVHSNGTRTNDSSYTYWLPTFRRAPGFFDVVAYTGIGGAGQDNVFHNLGVAPELVIIKSRSQVGQWDTLSVHVNNWLNNGRLNASSDFGANGGSGYLRTAPTDTKLDIGSSINDTGQTYIAYLFATLAGVSKVGSYTGNGTSQTINCGFTTGARFILIKRTDSTGDWYVWDTARGIVTGNDPYLLLNSTAAEVTDTDYIDPLSSGFQISSTAPAAINASGGTYIFLAIA